MIDGYTKVGRFFPRKPVIMDNLEKYPNEVKNVYELSNLVSEKVSLGDWSIDDYKALRCKISCLKLTQSKLMLDICKHLVLKDSIPRDMIGEYVIELSHLILKLACMPIEDYEKAPVSDYDDEILEKYKVALEQLSITDSEYNKFFKETFINLVNACEYYNPCKEFLIDNFDQVIQLRKMKFILKIRVIDNALIHRDDGYYNDKGRKIKNENAKRQLLNKRWTRLPN